MHYKDPKFRSTKALTRQPLNCFPIKRVHTNAKGIHKLDKVILDKIWVGWKDTNPLPH